MSNSMLSGWKPPARYVFAFCIVGLAFLGCFRYVLEFGVNVPFWDDFQLLDQVRQVYSGQMAWWKLLANKHNEHLLGVGFLIEALQFLWTGFNYKLQLVTGVVIQGITFSTLAAALWKFVPEEYRARWLGFSSLILFSLAQHKNLLWAFQTAWFLVSFLLAITLVCLCRTRQIEEEQSGGGGVWFAGAAFAAALASFTSSQGIIVWLAGAVYLIGACNYRVRDCLKSTLLRRWLLSAVVAGIVVAYVYAKLGGFGSQGGGFHVSTFLEIFIGGHGNFWGDWGIDRLICLGALMLAFVAVALVQVWLSKERAVYAFPVSLIAFGVCFVFLMASGRAGFGAEVASDSHYAAYPMLTYFGVLSILIRHDGSLPKLYRSSWPRFVFMAVVALAWFSSFCDATVQGVSWRSDHGLSAAQFVNFSDEPDVVMAQTLFHDPAMIRRNAEFMKANRLGPFGDPDAVPEAVKAYIVMPKSLEAVIARHPRQEKAVRMAWEVYQMGSDLRSAFNPLSDQFAHDLLQWCTISAQPGAGHYLSHYLAPFSQTSWP